MKKTILGILLIPLIMAGAAVIAFAQDQQDGSYRIQAEDQLDIRVWPGGEEFSMIVTVRPDGKISYLMTGEFKAEGLTIEELIAKITVSLLGYVNDPKVAVNVLNFKKARAFILGAVNRPGVYDVRKGTNVIDLISEAGGARKDAKTSQVAILRPPADKKYFDADKIARGEVDPMDNITLVNVAELLGKGIFPSDEKYFLKDGDIVYLPTGKKVDWAKLTGSLYSIFYLFSIDNIINPN
jgi:polysaccharide biosynthesis/export protein